MEVEQDVSGFDVSFPHDEYRHEPLIAEDAVRVLVLEPADHFESPLYCSITQHRRDSQSRTASGCKYSAVSYTWGGFELSHQLLVRTGAQSRSYLRITANVDSLLRHFRVPHKARLLWIDAICLNQKDETEKTQQIPLMGRIYNDAKRVHIWLGDEEVDKAQHAFAVIRDIERKDQRKTTEKKLQCLDEEELQRLAEEELQCLAEEELQCLAEFFNTPWFTRRWVIQEAFFSHDAAFHCGIHKLSLSRVMAALGKINGAGGHELVGYGARMLLTSIGSRNVEKKGLLSFLWDFHESECSDPRDRIAAVYSLVTDGKRPPLQYSSRDWKAIYMDVASYFIKNSPSFSITEDSVHDVLLHLCRFGPVESETDADCPSWVPDWSKRRSSSLPYGLVEPSLYYSTMVSRDMSNFSMLSFDSLRMLNKSSDPRYSHWLELLKLWPSLRVSTPACMKSEVIGQRLRFSYHPLVFFHQCGKVDLVIHCSTAPEFRHKVAEVLEIPTILEHRSAKTGHPLLRLLAHTLVKLDGAAGETKKDVKSYSEEILEELHAHRDNPEALNGSQGTNLQHIGTSLRHLSIVRIQTSTRSYWAIGPPDPQLGDWIVPLLLPHRGAFVPTICLRPVYSEKTKIREAPRVSHAAGIEERCLRFLGDSIAKAKCMHVKARFVGSGGHCDGTTVQFYQENQKKMADMIVNLFEGAKGEGLPGPVVFDIV